MAGRHVAVNAYVLGKIVAAGNMMDLGGQSTNAILAANSIHFEPTSVVNKDAYVVGGTINNEGNITGQLAAMTDNFQNNGTIGHIELRSQDSMIPDIEDWLNLFGILFVMGFAILGIILVKILPKQFDSVRLVMKKSVIKNIVGFLLIILFLFVVVLSAITVIGMPVSAFGLLVLLIGLILSSLVGSFAIGKKSSSY